jgi:FlaA1/EpsC-like NDP-sugar epimerase
VLVTGAAGSIGSEIAAQVLRFRPARLLCLDHDENALFFLEKQLAPLTQGTDLSFVLADVTDASRIARLFERARPQIVYHAAAHKHVPIVEANPVEGLRNNVFGTFMVASAAHQHGAERFVLISTDKAVNPTSIMGASKRIAELVLHTFESRTRFCAVRFGNVLGSQGSVVPIFKAQIAVGGPVTVTHPEMRRYFMTIPEAVELVIQASAMGRGGELFMLEMGEPVRIVDLAKDLIRLSGLRAELDIKIEFTGIRPGEKLREELYFDHEKADRTQHPKIMLARQQIPERERLRSMLDELRRAVEAGDDTLARRLVPRMVPEYRGHYGQVVELPVDVARSAAGGAT